MGSMSLRTAAAIVALLTLTACARHGALSAQVEGGSVLLTDAEWRTVFWHSVGNESWHGRVVPRQVTCAEPSPDIAKAFASSFNFGSSWPPRWRLL
jgi:hypothetical protein